MQMRLKRDHLSLLAYYLGKRNTIGSVAGQEGWCRTIGRVAEACNCIHSIYWKCRVFVIMELYDDDGGYDEIDVPESACFVWCPVLWCGHGMFCLLGDLLA